MSPASKNKTHKKIVINALEDLKAQDITVIEVEKISSITDVMIVATGTSNRHVKAVANNLIAELKKKNITILGTEGEDTGEWVLVDSGSIITHIMAAKTREFYELEKLWTLTPDQAKAGEE